MKTSKLFIYDLVQLGCCENDLGFIDNSKTCSGDLASCYLRENESGKSVCLDNFIIFFRKYLVFWTEEASNYFNPSLAETVELR